MIKAAAAVPALRVADPVYNTDEIIRIMNEYSDCGLIVFPELCITAYTCGDLFGQKALLDEAEDQLFRIAKETEKLSVPQAVTSFCASAKMAASRSP